jgi:SRP19 protein
MCALHLPMRQTTCTLRTAERCQTCSHRGWPAAVERPFAPEMYDAIVKGLCLNARLEMNKKYSRDWLNPGRVCVTLKRGDGAPCNTEVPTKAVLLTKCADLCKRHHSRPKRLEDMKKQEVLLFTGGAPPPKDNKASAAGVEKSGKGGKKKGKKK